MKSVSEASAILFENLMPLKTKIIPLMDSYNSVLVNGIIADRAFPPFNRVTMDGIVVRFSDIQQGQTEFEVVGVQAAGQEAQFFGNNCCLEIMTGAVMPEIKDATIVPVENIEWKILAERKKIAKIIQLPNAPQMFVHGIGTDAIKGQVLCFAGERLNAVKLAVAASVGAATVKVAQPPRIALIATGDELVEIQNIPLPHQIRMSNVYMMSAMLQKNGIESEIFHCRDNQSELIATLTQLLNRFDCLVLSGGVSKGSFDYIPAVLADIGVIPLFHGVAQRPGKPLYFGKKSGNNVSESFVFGLPGNPVSSLLTLSRYVIPWINGSMGCRRNKSLKMRFATKPQINENLTCFIPVQLINENGNIVGMPLANNGSGDFIHIADASGFVEVPSGIFDESASFDYIPLEPVL